MSVPPSNEKLIELNKKLLLLAAPCEQPRRRACERKLDFDKRDGIPPQKDLVQMMGEKAVVNASMWKRDDNTPKRKVKVFVRPDNEQQPESLSFQTNIPSSFVSFSGQITSIASDLKTLQDRNEALVKLRNAKRMSIDITPALKVVRARSRATEDIPGKKSTKRSPTPHPSPRKE